jgi:hypothetical protein
MIEGFTEITTKPTYEATLGDLKITAFWEDWSHFRNDWTGWQYAIFRGLERITKGEFPCQTADDACRAAMTRAREILGDTDAQTPTLDP